MRTPSVLLLFGLLLLPAACGGGGGAPRLDVGYMALAGGPSNDDAGSIATFTDGSCVVTGSFAGTCIWGLGEPGQTTLTSTGSTDIFVARYKADGTLAWARRAGGGLVDHAWGIATVPDGSCILTGSFQDVATFGAGQANVTVLDDVDGDGDAFVARYNADGTMAWAKRAGRNFSDSASSVAANADGSCVITGSYDTIATFGPGEANSTTLNAVGGTDLFVAAYQPDGALAWAVSAGGTGSDVGTGIDLLDDGSSLVTGYYGAVATTFGVGDPNQTALPYTGSLDVFVARYNADGTLAWVRRAGGPSFDEANSISAFTDGGCVIGGFFVEASVFGPGELGATTLTSISSSGDYFLARYAPDGELMWARSGGGGEDGDSLRSVAAGADGSCVVAGQFEGVAVFDPDGPGQTFRIAEGLIDAFVARFGADGRLLWVRTIGGIETDKAFGAAVYSDGSVAACGSIVAPALISPGSPGETLLTGPGLRDVFILRFNPDGSL